MQSYVVQRSSPLFLILALLSSPLRAAVVEENLADSPQRILHHSQQWGQLGINAAAHETAKPAAAMKIGGRTFPKGLGLHASSEMLFSLDASCRTFEAEIGIQDGQRGGSAEFEVRLDGKSAFKSGILREGDAPRPVRVDLTGSRLLELYVTDAGDGIGADLANWGNARIIRDDSVAIEQEPQAEDLDIAPFGTIIGSDPRRADGVHNGRFDTFPKYELNPDWPLSASDAGCTTTEPQGGEVSIGLRWLERRRLRTIALQLPAGAPLPDPARVRVQRWVFEKAGASPGGSRWQGHWKDMPGNIRAVENTLRYTLDWQGDFRARNEGALKIRWCVPSDKPLFIQKLSAWTDTPWTTSTVTLQTLKPLPPESRLDVYNGTITSGPQHLPQLPLSGTEPVAIVVRHSEPQRWNSDATVLRFSLADEGFGVAMSDLLTSRTMYVPQYDISLTLDPPLPASQPSSPPPSILDQVRAHPDQTFQQALAALARPDAHLGPTMLSLACDNRKYVLQRPGQIAFETSASIYNEIHRERPTKYTCLFEPYLGSGSGGEITRQLEDGWLPIPTITTRRDGIELKQTVFVAPLGGDSTTTSLYFNHSRAVAVADFSLHNPTTSSLPVQLQLRCFSDVIPGPGYLPSVGVTTATASLRDNVWIYEKDGILACAMLPPANSHLTWAIRDGIVTLHGTLSAGARENFAAYIPGWESTAAEIAALPSATDLHQATCAHWQHAMSEAAQIHLPDPLAENLIRASQVHCLIAARNNEARTIAPWIGSVTYGPLESESQSIIRGMEGLGHFEFARRAHDYFISRYNSEGYVTPTYTIVGTGWHLWALGEYVRLSGDHTWMKQNAAEILRVCRWIQAQLAKTDPTAEGHILTPLSGLMPPGAIADWESFASWYSLNGWFYAGLHSAATALQSIAAPEATPILATADKLARTIRASFSRTRAHAPVVPLRTGQWVPFYPSHPECPMPVEALHANEDAGRSWCYDIELGAHHLVPQGVLDPNGPETDDMINHLEDIQFLRAGWNCYPAEQVRADWFNLGGFAKVQPFYARVADIYAMRDDIKPFLRTWINSAASLVNREDLSLWEHFFNGAWNKTHETGWFLNQSALVFATERNGELWLAPFVSDQWLKDGMTVEATRIPTSYGRAGFRLISHIAENRIEAEIESPTRSAPKSMRLRIRHPEGKAVQSVEVNGRPDNSWDPESQTLRLQPSAQKLRVSLQY